MSSEVYQKGKDEIAKQNLDLVSSANLVVVPMSDSYTPDFETDEFLADVNADELDCDGYTQGFGSEDRKTPANRVLRRDDSNGRIEFDFDDVTLSSLGGGVSANNDSIGGYIIAEERNDDSDSVLVAFDGLQDNRATNGSDITYSPDAEGAIQLT